MTDDEKFFAWLDGELRPAQAAEMEAKVAADPRLAQLAEQHRAFGARLHGAFDPIAAAPVPKHLRQVSHPRARIVDIAAERQKRRVPSLPQWTSLAAMLAFGLFAGSLLPREGNAPVEVQGGKIYAAAALNHALDTELASAPSGDVRIGITFRDHAGDICRTFSAPASSGLACRSGGRWQLKGMFAAPEAQGSEYRMAAGMDPTLASLVDATIAGEPFDATGEKASRDRSWR